MIKRKNVLCGKESYPLELEINVDTVYRRYNIHEYINTDGIEGYEYDEDEMSLVEYFKDSLPKNQAITEATLGELSILLATYQEQVDQTLAELSILIGGGAQDNV